MTRTHRRLRRRERKIPLPSSFLEAAKKKKNRRAVTRTCLPNANSVGPPYARSTAHRNGSPVLFLADSCGDLDPVHGGSVVRRHTTPFGEEASYLDQPGGSLTHADVNARRANPPLARFISRVSSTPSEAEVRRRKRREKLS
uniref:Uncharacterized protein n=1 Tax=Oryza nivara TaxID=4536 RepID=A0A0E0GN91_ORYNI